MNPLVTPAWLAARLQDPNTVILDASLPPVGITPPPNVHTRYLSQHLPNALFFDIDALSDHSSGLPHTLPSPESFGYSLSVLGLAPGMTFVVYEQEGVFSAPRAWWMLRLAGARHVYLLDGGLRAWTEAGLPTAAGPVQRPLSTFEAERNPEALKDFAQIQKLIAQHGQILDARSEGRFQGTSPEPRPGLSSGHMPGATNLPFTQLCENGRLKPARELRQIFAAKHVDLQQPITTTCGSGVTAAVLALALEICQAAQVSLYDGSWAEYAQQPGATIVKDTL